jgi:hypothetical protein
MIPVLLTPTVGLIPTIPLTEAGHTTDPSVSVPSNTKISRRQLEPALEPQDYDLKYKDSWLPPLLLHPEQEDVDLKLAHSLKFVLINTAHPYFLYNKASVLAILPH